MSNSAMHLAETSAVEIVEGLDDFFLAVHYERAVSHDGLVDRFAAQQHQYRIGIGFDFYAAALPVELYQLAFTHDLATVDQHRAVQHDQRQRVACLGIEAG